ncbi:MAG: hypothetical protein PSV26_10785 [Polaromonas sp.]|uniref:hypothetical protein n=1 Tax=Polaromonas sp. TaxID=1869339 RepID=UPI002488E989|nr:hypothetical protein [Polaromonas sp.]MDI1237955.1 hypothetical protein [Polaromonas sp.]MDI1338283.1 hypothetical protein [Polaromonas sp.]
MLHPLFSILVRRPDLVVDHLSAYGALVHEEVSEAGSELLQRALAWGAVILCAGVFLTLAGVALMLGLLLNQFHWVLVAMPAVMLLFLLIAFGKARQPLGANGFAELKDQLERDAQALRAAA